jgi:hypothetical protein
VIFRSRDIAVALGLSLSSVLCCVEAFAVRESDRPVKRARPPKWSADELNVFFEDAREKLVGTRPDYDQAEAVVPAGSSAASVPANAGGSAGSNWSKLIDADTLETEIKRFGQEVAKHVTTPFQVYTQDNINSNILECGLAGAI